MSPKLLYRNTKLRIYRAMLIPFLLYAWETWYSGKGLRTIYVSRKHWQNKLHIMLHRYEEVKKDSWRGLGFSNLVYPEELVIYMQLLKKRVINTKHLKKKTFYESNDDSCLFQLNPERITKKNCFCLKFSTFCRWDTWFWIG